MIAYSRAQKRKAKKAKANAFGLPELAATPKRDKSGCFVERTRQQADDPAPREVVLKGRCRMLGLEITKENMALVDTTLLSDPAGAVIYLSTDDTVLRAKLWKTFSDMDRADEVYHRRILGKSRHAKCGKIEFYPERISSENAPARDDRDDDTKDRDAVNGFMYWRGLAQGLGARAMTAIFDAMYLRVEMARGGVVLPAGERFFDAVKDLTKAAEKTR